MWEDLLGFRFRFGTSSGVGLYLLNIYLGTNCVTVCAQAEFRSRTDSCFLGVRGKLKRTVQN